MKADIIHLADKDLVLAADGELAPRRKAEVAAHLEVCWSCRERMASLENTIADFVRARNRELAEDIAPDDGPAALLRARLSEAASAPRRFRFRRAGFATLAFAAALLAILITFDGKVNAEGAKPRFALTPGETRPITLAEVCLYQKAEVISRDIPEDKKREVYALYGIREPREGQFEVDYLITPDLGGTESVRNLWPQPYSVRWNAHVKDELEQRLHELVCSGHLSLSSAQHDIAVDWIGAYRKYIGDRASK